MPSALASEGDQVFVKRLQHGFHAAVFLANLFDRQLSVLKACQDSRDLGSDARCEKSRDGLGFCIVYLCL